MIHVWSLIAAIVLFAASASPVVAKKCAVDSVQVGIVCVDKYEASVWSTTDTSLVRRIQKGKITSALDLAGATQHGATGEDYGTGCPRDADGCMDHYAVSIPNVIPSAYVTWFQAGAACRNAGKRLATNYEWQMAAFGTPDPGTDDGMNDCNVNSALGAVATGSRSGCVSDVGALDMVGNLWEWVADWADRNSTAGCTDDWTANQSGIPGGGDYSCYGGDGNTAGARVPGAVRRGGYAGDGTLAGVFAVYTGSTPSHQASSGIGFRCAR